MSEIERTYDAETLKYIANVLREGTVRWFGRNQCLNRNRRKRDTGEKTKAGKPIYLWERQCDKCKEWFLLRDNILEVDHIEEIGAKPKTFEELGEHIRKVYCRQENLQALCIPCHQRKTSNFNAQLLYKRKPKKGEDYL